MNIISNPTYTATITVGSQYGYTKNTFSKELLIEHLQQFQRNKIEKQSVYLSACVSECEIVMSGQIEPHYQISFINYPKFPLDELTFKKEIESLTLFLMNTLQQNRVVVVYHDETKMYEIEKHIDPRI